MRLWQLGLALLAMSAHASAQTAPPTMIVGEMAASGSNGCYIAAGFSTYQRNFGAPPAAGTKASILFPTAFCNHDNYSGLAVMTFTSATAGVIRFVHAPDTPRGTQGVPFANYSESYLTDGHEVVVKFNVPGLWPVTLTLEPAYR